VCCSMLQRIAVCCSALQCVTVYLLSISGDTAATICFAGSEPDISLSPMMTRKPLLESF